jgi:L-galactose dehydrogenase
MAMRYRTLGKTGLNVSIIGFGAAPLGGVYGPFSESESTQTVHQAIDKGINLFDTSPYYGIKLGEEVLGRALKGVRDKVILATKCGRITKTDFNFKADFIVKSMEESLKRLQTDHVDIFQAHDIEFEPDLDMVFTETYEALQKLKKQGKCRFIGMTGYPLGCLKKALESCSLDVCISYCHCTLLDQSMLSELVPVAERRGTGIMNASPLAMGMLTLNPPEWHPAPVDVKEAAMKAAQFCKARGSDLSLLAMQWVLQQEKVATTFVGMSRLKELEINLKGLESSPDPVLLAEVNKILAPVQGRCWPSGLWAAEA